VAVACLRDWRDLTENFSFRIEPIVERRSTSVSSLTVQLIGAFRDQDVQIIARRRWQAVKVL
jgi:hypothetical protein